MTKAVFDGELKLIPGRKLLRDLLRLQSASDMVPVHPNQIHLTLLDAAAVKALGADFSDFKLPAPPPIKLDGCLRCSSDATYVMVDDFTQGVLEVYVRSILFDLGLSPNKIDATLPATHYHFVVAGRARRNPRDLRGRYIPPRYLKGVDAKKRAAELTVTRDLYKQGFYVEPPSDVEARKAGLVKPSSYTLLAKERGIEYRGNILDMAKRVIAYYGVWAHGMHVALALQQSYNKGLAAWASGGHRPGATAQNWAAARVNSLVVGGKTSVTADRKQFDMFGPALRAAIEAQR